MVVFSTVVKVDVTLGGVYMFFVFVCLFHVCLCVCMHACAHACSCKYICMCVRVRVHACACVHKSTCNVNASKNPCLCKCK